MTATVTRRPLADTRARIAARVVGRGRELDLVLAAVAAGRDVVLEGPPGTSKTTLLRAITAEWGIPLVFVEGNADLTPAKLVGHHNPARVLREDYSADNFVDGPLLQAMRAGGFLYIEEFNRAPEDTLNTLLTAMAERTVDVPRVGHVEARPTFRVIASMNPYDNVGTTRLSTSVHDRLCRLAIGYQDAAPRSGSSPSARRWRTTACRTRWSDALQRDAVALTRATREHPDVRQGSSVRGAIDLTLVAAQLLALRGHRQRPATPPTAARTAPAARTPRRWSTRWWSRCPGASTSTRRSTPTPERVLREIWEDHFVLGPGRGRPRLKDGRDRLTGDPRRTAGPAGRGRNPCDASRNSSPRNRRSTSRPRAAAARCSGPGGGGVDAPRRGAGRRRAGDHRRGGGAARDGAARRRRRPGGADPGPADRRPAVDRPAAPRPHARAAASAGSRASGTAAAPTTSTSTPRSSTWSSTRCRTTTTSSCASACARAVRWSWRSTSPARCAASGCGRRRPRSARWPRNWSDDDLAVVAFWSDAAVVQPLGRARRAGRLLDTLLRIPARGLTNIAFPLQVARRELARVPARDARVAAADRLRAQRRAGPAAVAGARWRGWTSCSTRPASTTSTSAATSPGSAGAGSPPSAPTATSPPPCGGCSPDPPTPPS